MKYFQSVVDFVNENFLWVIIVFSSALLIELITVSILVLVKKEDMSYFSEKFALCILTDIIAVIGLFLSACLVVGFINCIADQDWHFFTNYMGVLKGISTTVYAIIFIVLSLVAGVIYFTKGLHWALCLFLGGLSGAIALFALMVAGFIIYVVIAIVIIILKLIWFLFSGFFISIYIFVRDHWLELLIAVGVPGLIYGLIHSLIIYLRNLKDDVSW